MLKATTTLILALVALLGLLLMGCMPMNELPPPKEVKANADGLRDRVTDARHTFEANQDAVMQALTYGANIPEYAGAAQVARGVIAALPGLLTAADIAAYRYQYVGLAYEDAVRAVYEAEHAVSELGAIMSPLQHAFREAKGALDAAGAAPDATGPPARTSEGAAVVDPGEGADTEAPGEGEAP